MVIYNGMEATMQNGIANLARGAGLYMFAESDWISTGYKDSDMWVCSNSKHSPLKQTASLEPLVFREAPDVSDEPASTVSTIAYVSFVDESYSTVNLDMENPP